MRALVYVEPRKAELREWPDPVIGPGEGIVHIHAAGVCGSDLHIWLGHTPALPPPRVLGHELTGILEQVNGEAGALKSGDHVTVFPHAGCGECRHCADGHDALCPRKRTILRNFGGGFAEYVRMPLKNLYRIPETTGFVEGTIIEPLACALHAIGKCGEGKVPIAVVGAGPIGLLILQVARQLDFPKVAVLEVRAQRLAQARDHGADLAVNPQDPASLEAVNQFFGDEGCSVAFDAAGVSASRQLAVRLARSKGLVVSIGIAEEISPIDFGEIISREVRIEGSIAYTRKDFESAIRWVSEGRVSLKGWVSEAPLADGQAVFDDLVSANSSRIKAVLKVVL
jgi:2-desacetyl-2-hydroxyethyl bacteriochlorophyllide A dehydrogenase